MFEELPIGRAEITGGREFGIDGLSVFEAAASTDVEKSTEQTLIGEASLEGGEVGFSFSRGQIRDVGSINVTEPILRGDEEIAGVG